jgi:hypothetical protein
MEINAVDENNYPLFDGVFNLKHQPMKTAMQELFEFIDYEFGFKWDDDTKQKFKELLEKEKEQIIDASKHSYIAGYLDNQCKVDESMNFPEEYYNQTYNDTTRTNSNI